MNYWEQINDLYFRAKNSVVRGYSVSQNRKGMMPKVRIVGNSGTEYEDLDIITTPGSVTHTRDGDKTEYLILSVGGDLSHAVAIPIGDRKNFKKLEKPGYAIHDPDNPSTFALFDEDGVTLDGGAGKKVRLDKKTGAMTVEGDLRVKGKTIFEGGVLGHGPPGQEVLKIETSVRVTKNLGVSEIMTAVKYQTGLPSLT